MVPQGHAGGGVDQKLDLVEEFEREAWRRAYTKNAILLEDAQETLDLRNGRRWRMADGCLFWLRVGMQGYFPHCTMKGLRDDYASLRDAAKEAEEAEYALRGYQELDAYIKRHYTFHEEQ